MPISKIKLSASTDGRGKKIAAIATAGDLVHTAIAGIMADNFDEIWIWAYNSHTSPVDVTVEFGGALAPDDNIVVTLPAKSGVIPIVPGLILQGSNTVKIFASVANKVVVFGFSNRITP